MKLGFSADRVRSDVKESARQVDEMIRRHRQMVREVLMTLREEEHEEKEEENDLVDCDIVSSGDEGESARTLEKSSETR